MTACFYTVSDSLAWVITLTHTFPKAIASCNVWYQEPCCNGPMRHHQGAALIPQPQFLARLV